MTLLLRERTRRRNARRAAGFTLVELLIVIAIIAALAGLITTAVNGARKRSLIATATSDISALKTALTAYHTQIGAYPGGFSATAQDNPEWMFRALYTGNPKHGGSRKNLLEDWPTNKIGAWRGEFVQDPVPYDPVPEEALDFSNNYSPMVLLDAWDRPYHYIQWDSLPRSKRTLPGGQIKAKGGMPFMIWSDGPNMKNDWGEEDDVTSWKSN